MASGEHVVEDLFGFAELTGETVPAAIDATNTNHMISDKKPEESTKYHSEKEKIKRDTDEVVVPIFFEKSGVKKYKVLARHQVEDDEDIKRPVCSERGSPNSEEQRKENIDIDRKGENFLKKKTDIKGNVKKQKVKKIEISKEHSIKNLKQSINSGKLKGRFGKLQQRKLDEKGNDNIGQKEKKQKSTVDKDPRAVNYEFHDDSDSNTELHKVKTKVKDEVGCEEVKPCSSGVGEIEDCCKIINLEKAPLAQNPLKIECLVKLRRDPSIENLYKTKTDDDIKDSDESECSDAESLADCRIEEVENELTKQSDSSKSETVSSQNSSEESLMKAANMIYNVDIEIRKSGRLKSAKCASRYRGDYGIRVDTYKQLINKTGNTSSKSDITESDGKELSKRVNIDESKTEELKVSNDIVKASTDRICEKQTQSDIEQLVTSGGLQNEIFFDSVKGPQLEIEFNLCKDEKTVLCDNDKVDIPTGTCKSERSSAEFTVLKEPFAYHSGTDTDLGMNLCSKTENLSKLCKVNGSEDSKAKCHTENKDLLNCDTVYHKEMEVQLCDKEVSEVETETSEHAEDHLPQSECGECIQQLSNDSVDSCSCKSGSGIVGSNNEYNSGVRETECPEVISKVPCTNVIEGNQSIACDIRLDNDSLQSERNASCELSDHEVKSDTNNLVPVSSETETDNKSKKEIHSQLTKENINEMHALLQSTAKNNGKEYTGYVHSVGKSVNKMQKRIKTKRPDHNIRPDNIENEATSETSPIKDPAQVLETLRQKLFENAGADVEEADKVPKQFESKLISSKQRQSEDSKSSVVLDIPEKDRQIKDSDSTSGRSGKSTPRCSTPRQESSTEILEEVAVSLDVLHQAKRRFENSSKVAPSKRQRFEEKTFLLRSMNKRIDDADGALTSQYDVAMDDEKPVRIAERTRSSRSSAESSTSKSDVHRDNRKNNVKTVELKVEKRDNTPQKTIPKPKPVKCSACSHIFKTKDLLRKHFPCRIRQTRTWSQNKLRPNRAVKRIENGSKKFVCKLPKAGKPEPSKPRPQLLTYRKTKFRRVKGKRRRKLYQLIQELRQRRMPVKWRHLSIVYHDLSFKEQCLYKLGLICVGSASEGLERYTADEITVFEKHRAKEKWLMEDAQTFEHSIPDTLESLTELNLSTELITDNQETDFFSPNNVIIFPQENIRNRICDIDDTIKGDKVEGATNETSIVKIYENDLIISENKDSVEKNIPACYAFYPGLEEKESDTVYEEVEDLAYFPEKLNADISIQEYLDFFRSSKTNKDSDHNDRYTGGATIKTSPRSQNIAQLETFAAAVEEGNECFEETLVISQDSNEMISLEGNLIDDPFRSADVTEINIKTTDLKPVNEWNTYETEFRDVDHAHTSKMNESSDYPSNGEHPDLSQKELMSEYQKQEEDETSSERKHVSDKDRLSCTYSNNASKADLDSNKCFEKESRDDQETDPLELCKDSVISSDTPLSVKTDIQKPAPEPDSSSAFTYTEKDIRKPVLESESRYATISTEKNIQKPVPVSENKSALKYPAKDSKKDILLLDKRHSCSGKCKGAPIKRTSCGNEMQEQLNTFSPRKKNAVVPDIELFHQTAIIDDTLLADTPLAVQHDTKSDKDNQMISPSNTMHERMSKGDEIIERDYITGTKSVTNLDSELVYQASGILKDILGDVEQSVNNGIEAHTSEVKKYMTSAIDDNASVENNVDISKVTNVNLNISPVRGILKNAGPRRDYAGVSLINLKTGLTSGKVNKKAPEKKKIDFKTYAKRKGMIKEKYEKEKEYIQSEVRDEIEESKTKEIRNEKDENGKECLRSESHEIEDGLLGRLLDAVNVIDSIIEEHRYQSEPEDDDSFNAITPEMAFEAAISNKRIENTNLDAVSKPYDIESVFPYSETDKMINSEILPFSGIQDLFENNENDSCYNPLHPYIDNVLPSTEIPCTKSSNFSLDTSSDYNKTVEIDTHISLYTGDDVGIGEPEDGTEIVKGTQVLTETARSVILERQTHLQTVETEGKFEILESESVEHFIDNTDEKVSHERFGDTKDEESEADVSENNLDQEVTVGINAGQPSLEEVNSHLKPPVNEHVMLENDYMEMRSTNDSNTKAAYSKDHIQQDIYREDKNENVDELMKSPEHIPKKRKRRPDDATSIKESKRDFTIKYEMNGIVIKEDLLTGDKNVVENSSPFRSSAESDSNFDQSSVSELEVSSIVSNCEQTSVSELDVSSVVVENDTSFSSNMAFEDIETVENSNDILGKIESNLMLDSNVEDDTDNKGDMKDIFKQFSDEEVIATEKQVMETHSKDTNHVLEEPVSNLSFEVNQELDLENQSERVSKDAELNIDMQKADNDADFNEEIHIDTCAESSYLNTNVNCDEELPVENVPCLEMEPLLRTDVQLLKKVSDDHSVGSPPVLEKVEVSDSSMDEQDKENTNQGIALTVDGGPPLLEPQLLEESDEEHLKQTKQETAIPGKQERHFLDILGMVSDKGSDFKSQTENLDERTSKRSKTSLLEGLYSEESTLSDSIGRHFSDVVSETVEAPKTPKSKLQFLFDKSERGDVTLAEIKEVLSPFSKKGKKKSIPKESLLKIKSGIADLLSNVKKTDRSDPAWLKRDSLSGYSRKKNKNKKLSYKNEKMNDLESSSDESIASPDEIIDISSESSDPTDMDYDTGNKNPSKCSVADTIMQMLDSLQDKGNVADNMSNLLDILAETLGFLGEGKVGEQAEELSSDSDYSYNDEVSLTKSSSTENSQKELIADYLEEGDQPPSLDDIPVASTFDFNWKKDDSDTIKDDKERFIETKEILEQAPQLSVKNAEIGFNSLAETNKQTHLEGVAEIHRDSFDTGEVISKKTEIPVISFVSEKNELGREPVLNDTKSMNLNVENSEENTSVTTEHSKDDKRKATTIFKSITELNSIETDEESNTDESFDTVSMSVRLSELKDTNTWEFNSDYNTDQEQSDNFDSELENDVEPHTEHAMPEEDASATSPITRDNLNDAAEKESPEITNFQYLGIPVDSAENKDGKMFKCANLKSDELFLSQLFSKESSNQVFSELNEKSNHIEDTRKDFKGKQYATKLNSTQVKQRNETEVSQPTPIFDNTDMEHASEINQLSDLDVQSTKNITDRSLPSSNTCIANNGTEKRYTSFVKKIEEAAAIFNHEAEAKEDKFIDDHQNEEQEVKDLNFHENTLAGSEELKNNNRHTVPVESSGELKDSDDIHDSTEVAESDKKQMLRFSDEETEFTSQTSSLKNNDKNMDHELISEVNDLPAQEHMSKTMIETETRLRSLNTDKNVEDSHIIISTDMTSSFNDSHVSTDDEDTNETVTYDEQERTKTDISGLIHNTCDTNLGKDKVDDSILVNDDLGSSFLFESSNSQEIRQWKEADNNESEKIQLDKGKLSFDKQHSESEESRQETQFQGRDTYGSPNIENTQKIVLEDEQYTKNRSISFNLDDADFSDNYCESIAEKVKRKQRERSKSVCYSFNPWLYYSAAYVREVTKPAKKEISVFRSSILEKRAREKSFSPEKDIGCSSRKKRNSSVPKEAKFGTDNENTYTDHKTCSPEPEPKPVIQLKPCSVAIPKLTEDIIHRYTNRKRKPEEDISSENRPPIKVTIKLSQIVYPPNSPYGSTSTSSDNYRSGYESCSEDSETDTKEPDEENEIEVEKHEEVVPKYYCAKDLNHTPYNNERSLKTEMNSREPLKIKMRTLLTKMNSCEERHDAPNSIQEIEPVSHFSGSFNESSNETNIEVSTGELIESEVLHDIKRECEKVKSRENDILFYLSESDDDSGADTSRRKDKQLLKAEKERLDNLRTDTLSVSSIQAECGESDVDLSDSDTDEEIQEEIDKILNSKSIRDFSAALNQDEDIATSQTKMKKGRSSLMKMIVSDLRLSESESDSEIEYKKAEEAFPEENYNDKSKVSLPDMGDASDLCVTENEVDSKVLEKDCIQADKRVYPTMSQVAENSNHETIYTVSARDTHGFLIQQNVHIQDQEFLSSELDFIDEEQIDMPDDADCIIEPLDLTMSSKKNLPSSSVLKKDCSEFPRGEMKGISNDIIEKKFSDESELVSCSEFQEIKTVQYSDKRSFNNDAVMSSSTLKQEETVDNLECSQLTEENSVENYTNKVVLAQKPNTSMEIDKSAEQLHNLENENLIQDQYKDFEMADTQDSLKYEVHAVNEVSSDSVPNFEGSNHGNDRKDFNLTLGESATTGPDNCAYSSEDVSENTVISVEETKEMENVNAVKNLEDDVFHEVQPIPNNTDDGMVYYAVELSDDLETNEAVVNLETVELIDGPIIIENNVTHEQNILDTNFIQSHVNDQVELSNETLNEQIVETIDETKLSSEIRINSALESITQMENPVFYPTVNDVKSKYLYGINEDSQSSNEVVEELVTDIVNDNTVLQDVEQVTIETQQILSEVSSIENPINGEKFSNPNPDFAQNIPENSVEGDVIPVNLVNSNIISESSDNTETFSDAQKTAGDHDKVIEVKMDTSDSRDSEMRGANDSQNIDCTSFRECDKWTDIDKNNLTFNISESNVDTREMCSQHDSFIPFKADNLSHGYDLIGNAPVVKESSNIDGNRICAESSDINASRLSVESDVHSLVQGYDNCAMIIEHSDVNDYIITQNENFDDDDDDDDEEEEAMELA